MKAPDLGPYIEAAAASGSPTKCSRDPIGLRGDDARADLVHVTSKGGRKFSTYLCQTCIEDLRRQPWLAELRIEEES